MSLETTTILGADSGDIAGDTAVHGDFDVGGGWAVFLLAAPVFAALCLAMGVISKRQEGRRVVISYEPHASTAAAITAIRAALGDMRLAAKRHTSSATVAALDIDVALVYKI